MKEGFLEEVVLGLYLPREVEGGKAKKTVQGHSR